MSVFEKLSEVFNFNGHYLREEYCSNGHINDTSRVIYLEDGREVSYIHQRINHHVFKDVPAVMENMVHVTRHQRRKLLTEGYRDVERRALSLIPTRDGDFYYQDSDGNYWRTFRYISGARGYEMAQSMDQLYQAARAFGMFQRQLADLEHPLHETIKDFHHTPKRFQAFNIALEKDPLNRASGAREAVDYTLSCGDMVDRITTFLESGKLPTRVTHNDTKLNNVLIDKVSGEGICVVDLDTVMRGSILFDFGDLVRAATCGVPEDASDLSGVEIDMTAYECILRGYLEQASDFLTETERQMLPFSSWLISLELGMRFLTDYLEGDHYFKTHRPAQNLDRCNRQYAMARSIKSRLPEMERMVSAASS